MSTAPQDQSASPWPRGSIPYSLNIHNPQGSKRPSLRESPECSRCCSLAQLTTNIGRSASASSLTLQKDQGCCLQGGGHRWAENKVADSSSGRCLLSACYMTVWMQYVFRSYFSYDQNISKVDIIPISFINEELGGGLRGGVKAFSEAQR